MGEPFRHTLRVRFNECDPQGIVFNGNYLVFFDVTLTELLRAALGSWHEMVHRGTDLLLVESRVTYRAPARSRRPRRRRAGDRPVRHDVADGDGAHPARHGDLLTDADLHYVGVSAEGHEKQPLPSWLRAALEPYAA